MPQPRCTLGAPGGGRSQRDFEPLGSELIDEIAGTADVDAESAAEPFQGSDTTFSSTQLRAASLTGLIEMIEP